MVSEPCANQYGIFTKLYDANRPSLGYSITHKLFSYSLSISQPWLISQLMLQRSRLTTYTHLQISGAHTDVIAPPYGEAVTEPLEVDFGKLCTGCAQDEIVGYLQENLV